jgi:isocitrate/isopropylmalate dehydrogenase
MINNKLGFGYNLYANLRVAKSYPVSVHRHSKPDIDIVVIRENSEGFCKALENQVTPGTWTSMRVFSKSGAHRIAELSFKIAESRNAKKKVALATKANIFDKSHGMYLDTVS